MQNDDSLRRSNRIDEICDQFEKQWLVGAAERIEDVLAEDTDVDRGQLLRERLLIELRIR